MELRAGAWEAVLLPEQGAAVARLLHAGRDLLVPVPPGADPNHGFHGAYVMAPWTNRLDGGRIEVGGRVWRMAVNRPEEDTALHGLLRERPWTVDEARPGRAVLRCELDHPPFRCAARLEAGLSEDRFTLSLALTNAAEDTVPMGIGWHPFFRRPPGTRLQASVRTTFGRDARNLPVGPRPSAGIAGGDAVLDGLDTHFAGWDGVAEIGWPDAGTLVLRAEGAWRSNLQVFAPRGAGVLAVEPVSHAPDAANRAAAARHGAMHRLRPGESLLASLMIHWR